MLAWLLTSILIETRYQQTIFIYIFPWCLGTGAGYPSRRHINLTDDEFEYDESSAKQPGDLFDLTN